jgi:hypothetical protein
LATAGAPRAEQIITGLKTKLGFAVAQNVRDEDWTLIRS